MYYGDKRTAKVTLYKALVAKGWKCYGFKADESDGMSDYYSPASWDGIATKNGLTIVVDNYNTKDTEAKEIFKTEYKANNKDIFDKIEKVQQLAKRGATEGEKASARNMLVKLNDRLDKESQKAEASKVLVDTIPAYSSHTTKRTLWHLEKDGIILAKGASLFTIYNLPNYYDVTTLTVNKAYHKRYQRFDYNGNDTWTPEKLIEFYTPSDQEEKAIKLLNKIITEVEKHAKEFETVTIGDGTKETEEKGKTRGYKKVVKTRIKKVVKAIEKPEILDMANAQYFKLVSSFNYGCTKGSIYKIASNNWGQSQKLNGKLTKLLTGANRSNTFTGDIEKLNNWLLKGAIIAVDVVEVEEIEEYDAMIKDDYQEPKQAKKSSNNSEKSAPVDENKTDDTEVKAEIKIVYNKDMNGIELYFEGKPSEQVRSILKSNKFRWHGKKKMWYAKITDERKKLVEQMAI